MKSSKNVSEERVLFFFTGKIPDASVVEFGVQVTDCGATPPGKLAR